MICSRTSRSGTHGINLVEVLLAISVLAVATLALLSVRTLTLQARQKTSERQTAIALALEVMTDAQAKIEADFDVDLEGTAAFQATGWPQGFSHTLTTQMEGPELRRVEVVLRWSDRHGLQEYRLWTKFTKSQIP